MKGLCKKIAATALAFLMLVSVLITAVPPEGFDWAIEAEAASASANYSELLAFAESYVNYQWTPSSNISTWNGNAYNGSTIFKKGVTVTGVPYTLFTTEVVSDSLLSLNAYKNIASKNYSTRAKCVSTSNEYRTGPVYGSCCATFISELFGFVNSSGNPKYDSVGYGQYGTDNHWNICNATEATQIRGAKASQIMIGDALSTPGHVIWIGDITDTHYVIYEQTPPVARKVTVAKANCINSSGYFIYEGNVYNHITRIAISGTSSPSTPSDTTDPVINNVQSFYLDVNTMRVTCEPSDNVGIDRVRIATWTTSDQSDLVWRTATHNGAGTYFVDVPFAEHKSKPDFYISHIYAYDAVGNDCSAETYFYPDNTAPVISDVKISAINTTGYEISCTINDASNIDRVIFPSWTDKNGQDDIIWYTGTVSGNTAKCWISASEHNDEDGLYHTHIYAYDIHNNSSCYGLTANIDRTNPVLIDYNVTNISTTGYTVSCTFSDNIGVTSVKFPTWTTSDQSDIIWYDGVINGNTASYDVKVSDHTGNSNGTFWTHVYIYDECGNGTSGGTSANVPIDSAAPVFEWVKTGSITANGYLVSCKLSDDYGVDHVAFPSRNFSDEYTGDWLWYDGFTTDGIYFCYVRTNDFENIVGETYHTHIYAYDASGNWTAYGLTVDVPTYYTEDLGDGFYATIDSSKSGNLLTMSVDDTSSTGYRALQDTEALESLNQLWYFERCSAYDNYRIYNVGTERYLTVEGSAAVNFTPVIGDVRSTDEHTASGQRWSIAIGPKGNYTFSPYCSPRRVIDVTSSSVEEGTKATIFYNHGSDITNQEFIINKQELATNVNLDTSLITLEINELYDISEIASVVPENAYVTSLNYLSDNESIASVSEDGIVCANELGTAIITVVSVFDETVKNTLTVNVIAEHISASGIVISSSEKTIAVGETAGVYATILPENNTENLVVNWSSSDESVATVANGIITAVGIGEATIIAKAGDFSFACEITVVQPITTLELLCDNTVTVENDNAFNTPVAIYPPDTTDVVSWVSSDESVAIVDENGRVIAVGAGECTITASAGDLSSNYSVEVPTAETTSLTLSTENTELIKGESLEVSALVYPANSTDTVIWTSSDESVATIVDGVVTAISAGTCTITAVSGSCSDSFALTVLVPASSVSLETNEVELEVGESYTFAPVVEPVDTTDILFWYVDKAEGTEPIVQIDENGKITGLSAGNTTVIAAIGDLYAVCNITVKDTNELAAPTNLYAYTFGYTSIKMTWDAVEGADGYEIYRCDLAGQPYYYIDEVNADETAYRNIGLSTGTTYYYKVRAFVNLEDGTKLYSDFSAYSSARPLPATPVVTATRTSATTATVSWVKIYGATGYSVYRSTEENGTYTFVANLKSGDATTYKAIGLASTTTYYYKVRAYRQMGDDMMFGSYSKPAAAFGAPATPVITARSVGYTSAKVVWEPVANADGYAIYRCDVGGGAYSYIASVGADVTSYTNTGLSTGTTYYYKVRAFMNVGSGKLYSNYSACATARPIPATPVVTVTADSATTATVSWVRIYGATGYSVYRSTEKDGTYTFLAGISSGDTVTYTDKNLEECVTYYYKVRAYRQMGSDKMFSNYSLPVCAKQD